MRYALIIAGGSGTRLWPMSRRERPKQLLPLVGGRSLLQAAFERLGPVVPAGHRLVCAAEAHRKPIVGLLEIDEEQFLGEPEGRDTLAAVTLGAAVVHRRDAEATVGVFTADHVIGPADTFRSVVENGFQTIERHPDALLTFGITPTHPATGYGYLELAGATVEGSREVRRFKEKPDLDTARRYLASGPGRYLWNSGMFIWKARTLLACVQKYEPAVHAGIQKILSEWDGERRLPALQAGYPALKKISVDYGVMEPASEDPEVPILALPMELHWRDIGSWASYAETCAGDAAGNAAPSGKSLLVDCRGILSASSDPRHLIAAVGCEDLIIVHTENATLVCPKSRAQEVRELQARILSEHGEQYL